MALPDLDPSRHRLEVKADLSFAVSDGKTRLKRSYAEPPLQVQRALYLDDAVPDMAFLYLLNPTPGIFQGDSQSIVAKAGPLTRVHLTTPSATKIYSMPDRDAAQTLDLTLEEGSYLEYLPEPLIPFRGSRLRQRTRASMDSGATLVMGEIVVPGRVASGESFSFNRLDRRLTVTGTAGQPLYHEASVLNPQASSPLGRTVLSAAFPVAGTLLIMSPDQDTQGINGLREKLGCYLSAAATGSNGPRMELSSLPEGIGLVAKALSKESSTVKAIFGKCLEIARRHFLRGSAPTPISSTKISN